MNFPDQTNKRKTRRAELLRRRAELASEQARIDLELAKLEDADPDDAGDYLDQNSSPFGKRMHLRLAPELGGVRAGKRVLIRRDAIDAYLAAHPVVRTARAEAAPPSAAPSGDSLDAVLAELGAKRCG